jgi:hypothetical protein
MVYGDEESAERYTTIVNLFSSGTQPLRSALSVVNLARGEGGSASNKKGESDAEYN